MKKLLKVTVNFAMVCMLVIAMVIPVQAASNTKKIQSLVNQMEGYELYSLFNIKDNSNVTKMTKKNQAKAVALSMKIREKDILEQNETDNSLFYKIRNNEFTKASVNIFGKKLKVKDLPKQSKNSGMTDAYINSDDTPVVYVYDGETEIDFVVNDTKINKKSSNIYRVEKYVYYGYWGENQGQSNYKIVYTLKKNKKSKYGFVISKMEIKSI